MKSPTALKWIISEAKDIQKKHPTKKWTSCVKDAGTAYRKKFGKAKAKTKKTGAKKSAKKSE